MSRLPVVDSDAVIWGTVLNDFLQVSHASNGTLLSGTVGATQVVAQSIAVVAIANGTITTTQLSSSIQTSLSKADNSAALTVVASTATASGQFVSIEKVDSSANGVTVTGLFRGVSSSSLDARYVAVDRHQPLRKTVPALSGPITVITAAAHAALPPPNTTTMYVIAG